ncbi:hypothetical protein BRARA_F01781, partial [Brassica rapa]
KREIQNSHNEKLVGLLHETGSREVVVLCHGFKSDKNNAILKNVAAALEKEGISAFRFDFSGNGESEGGFNYGNYNTIGHSRGGNVVLLYASKYCNDGNVRNVVNISGRYDLKKGIRLGDGYLERIKEQVLVTEESLMERLETDMHEACLKIDKQVRVLTVHGSGDKVVPVPDAEEFAKIIPNHKLEIVKKADHGYTKHQTQLVSTVLEFIK